MIRVECFVLLFHFSLYWAIFTHQLINHIYLLVARKQPDLIHHCPGGWTSISWSQLHLFQSWNVSHYWLLFPSGLQRRKHIPSALSAEESRLVTQYEYNLVLWPLSVQTSAHVILLITYKWKQTWWVRWFLKQLWLQGRTSENLQGSVPKDKTGKTKKLTSA